MVSDKKKNFTGTKTAEKVKENKLEEMQTQREKVICEGAGLKNVFLLPHMGSSTLEGRIEMGEKVIINIKTFIDGHRPPDQIVPSML